MAVLPPGTLLRLMYLRERLDLASDQPPERVDLVISCMVMEHLDEQSESAVMLKSSDVLADEGLMIGLVPGSRRFSWSLMRTVG
jgi:hypothetical protein